MPQEESSTKAATKVQEAAANVQQVARRKRVTGNRNRADAVVRRYFEAIAAHDVDLAVSMWADGGRENVRGQADVIAPEGVRTFIGGLLEAIPDLQVEILSSTQRTIAARCNGVSPVPSPARGASVGWRRPAIRSRSKGSTCCASGTG